MCAQTKFVRPCLLFVLACAICFVAPTAHATTVAVGSCTNFVFFTSIQSAVTAAPAGSTIEVCPGTYYEQVTITKKLTLIGVANTANGTDAAVIMCPTTGPSAGCTAYVTDIGGNSAAAQIFVDNASAVTLSHLTVDGSNNQLSGSPYIVGIYYKNSTGTITDSVVRNQIPPSNAGDQPGGLAINIESSTGSPAVTVTNNSVRNFDKNGISANGPGNGTGGPKVTIKGNTVVGVGATTVTAQNGIQIGYNATGTVENNYVADVNYTPATYTATGILIYGSSGVTVSGNTVESAQSGIYPASVGTDLSADNTTISSNHIGNTTGWDAIDLCSSNNTASSNTIYGASESGIHDDDECVEGDGSTASGTNNTIKSNIVNEACAGILSGSDSTTQDTSNTFMNVTNTIAAGDSCTPLANVKSVGKRKAPRPSPHSTTGK
jgi:hypothetical protein